MGLFDKIKDIMTDEEDDFDEYTEESAEFVKPPRRREREIEPPAYERGKSRAFIKTLKE